jgi:polyisoprenoid-binding protein YceI
MKKILLFLILFVFNQSYAQKWIATTGSVKFTTKMLGIGVNGSFKGLKATIDFNPENPVNASIVASVDAATVFTDNKLRDTHLKEKPEFFEVAKYPTLTMKSTSITKNGNSYMGTFNFTIKNITKAIKIPFTFTKTGEKGVFASNFEVDRNDWGLGGNTMGMSDKVKISLTVNVQQ